MPHSVELDLSSYDISRKNGFLPDDPPLDHLLDSCYQPWEAIIHDLPKLLQSRQLRSRINSLPTISTDHLTSTAEWRRAYVILSFFTHGYIWQGPSPAKTLPEQITVPFLIVADHFDLPTTASYSATNLWNFAPLSPGLSICDPDNLRALHTFTGTKDEEWFYMISVAMEARGGSAVPSLLRAVYAVEAGDYSGATDSLMDVSRTLNELGVLLDRMYEHCRPDVFYNHIRPMLAGTKNMGVAGLPHGVFYNEGSGKGLWRMYCGGSNAQSSLIQLFDAVLGITHESNRNGASNSEGYLTEMRRYMPAKHAEFLACISNRPSLRQFVNSHSANSPIASAYNAAVASLSALRDRHILIATRYIILPSKKARSVATEDLAVNLATVSTYAGNTGKREHSTSVLTGTGGTMLIPFLKQVRDETALAACG